MASITIRNLDESVKKKLRTLAAKNGRSMEAEARIMLREGVSRKRTKPPDLLALKRKHFGHLGGGVDLEIPPRGRMRESPDFS